GFLTPPETSGRAADQTEGWPPSDERRPPCGPETIDHVGAASVDDTGCFAPRAAIAAGTVQHTICEDKSVVRARLRELPMIYILILGIANFWRRTVLGNDDVTLYHVDAVVVVALGGLIALLSSWWPVSLAWLKAFELGMIGILASRIAFVQYRLM